MCGIADPRDGREISYGLSHARVALTWKKRRSDKAETNWGCRSARNTEGLSVYRHARSYRWLTKRCGQISNPSRHLQDKVQLSQLPAKDTCRREHLCLHVYALHVRHTISMRPWFQDIMVALTPRVSSRSCWHRGGEPDSACIAFSLRHSEAKCDDGEITSVSL